MINWGHDIWGLVILLSLSLTVLVVAELWKRLGNADGEHSRKLVHIGGGIVSLFIPWLFSSWHFVFVISTGLCLLFILGSHYGFLKGLNSVKRKSRGSEYYPIAIFIVYLLSMDRPWLFISSMSALVLADASAALVGKHYGKLSYKVESESKTLEGSLVFLLVAFLGIHLPVLLMSDLSPEFAVLGGLLVALLVTVFEAISLHGADNLFVPLGVCLFLDRLSTKPISELIYQNFSFLGIAIIIALLARISRALNVGGTLIMILFTYGCWSLGMNLWAYPIFTAFILFLLVWLISSPKSKHYNLKVNVMTQALIIPFVFLAATNATGSSCNLFSPFLMALIMVTSFAISKYLYLTNHFFRANFIIGSVTIATPVTGAVLLCPLLGGYAANSALLLLITASIGGYIGAWQTHKRKRHKHNVWQSSDFLIIITMTLVIVVMQLLDMIKVWDAVQ